MWDPIMQVKKDNFLDYISGGPENDPMKGRNLSPRQYTIFIVYEINSCVDWSFVYILYVLQHFGMENIK